MSGRPWTVVQPQNVPSDLHRDIELLQSSHHTPHTTTLYNVDWRGRGYTDSHARPQLRADKAICNWIILKGTGGKGAGACSEPLTSIWCLCWEWVELYLHFPIRLRGVDRENLTFFFFTCNFCSEGEIAECLSFLVSISFSSPAAIPVFQSRPFTSIAFIYITWTTRRANLRRTYTDTLFECAERFSCQCTTLTEQHYRHYEGRDCLLSAVSARH